MANPEKEVITEEFNQEFDELYKQYNIDAAELGISDSMQDKVIQELELQQDSVNDPHLKQATSMVNKTQTS